MYVMLVAQWVLTVMFLLNMLTGEVTLAPCLCTGAQAVHVRHLLPEQTKVGIHSGRI